MIGKSSFGGGIISGGKALTLKNCRLGFNSSPDFGGGLYSFLGGMLTILDTTSPTIRRPRAAASTTTAATAATSRSGVRRRRNVTTGKGGGVLLYGGAH